MIDRAPVPPGPPGHDQRIGGERDPVGAACAVTLKARHAPLRLLACATIAAKSAPGNGLYKAALLVFYRSREERARAFRAHRGEHARDP
jgi:hypothetical protein